MGSRLGARLIDGIIIFGIVLLVAVPLHAGFFHTAHTVDSAGQATTTTRADAAFSAGYYKALLVSALIGMLYEVPLIALRGATIGKSALGIKVVRGQAGELPGLRASFVRWVIPAAAGFVISFLEVLVYISPFFDNTRRRQGWHDRAADTFVIRPG
jgi:uncharacterized RDD family membrane protein YckC